jgi:hypothetical protein
MVTVPVGRKGIVSVSYLNPDLKMGSKSGFSVLLIDNDQALMAPLQEGVADVKLSVRHAATVQGGLEACAQQVF